MFGNTGTEELTSIFSAKSEEDQDLVSIYSQSDNSPVYSSNSSIYDSVHNDTKPDNSGMESMFSTGVRHSDITGVKDSVYESIYNSEAAYQQDNNVASLTNVRASNYGQESITDKMRGVQSNRLNADNGEISLAEMYNDSSLDNRFGGGQYNVTITDIYTDEALFKEYHGLNTDGKIQVKENYMVDNGQISDSEKANVVSEDITPTFLAAQDMSPEGSDKVVEKYVPFTFRDQEEIIPRNTAEKDTSSVGNFSVVNTGSVTDYGKFLSDKTPITPNSSNEALSLQKKSVEDIVLSSETGRKFLERDNDSSVNKGSNELLGTAASILIATTFNPISGSTKKSSDRLASLLKIGHKKAAETEGTSTFKSQAKVSSVGQNILKDLNENDKVKKLGGLLGTGKDSYNKNRAKTNGENIEAKDISILASESKNSIKKNVTVDSNKAKKLGDLLGNGEDSYSKHRAKNASKELETTKVSNEEVLEKDLSASVVDSVPIALLFDQQISDYKKKSLDLVIEDNSSGQFSNQIVDIESTEADIEVDPEVSQVVLVNNEENLVANLFQNSLELSDFIEKEKINGKLSDFFLWYLLLDINFSWNTKFPLPISSGSLIFISGKDYLLNNLIIFNQVCLFEIIDKRIELLESRSLMKLIKLKDFIGKKIKEPFFTKNFTEDSLNLKIDQISKIISLKAMNLQR